MSALPEEIIVVEAEQDQRLDVFLAQSVATLPSRSFAKKMIEDQLVRVNGAVVKPRHALQEGDRVVVDWSSVVWPQTELVSEDLPLDVFYEDDDLLVVHKPIGLTVHPLENQWCGTLVNRLIHHCDHLSTINGDKRPGIVHRLDKETSGLMVVAKTNKAHRRLAKKFERHEVYKQYVALVEGEVAFDEGVIDTPIGRHPKYHDARVIASVEDEWAKKAQTFYRVIERMVYKNKKITLIKLYPQTGRTHQLRLHMKHLGHPILGDEKYGRGDTWHRLALHAQALGFVHPVKEVWMEFSTSIPEGLKN